jgi:type III secretory pathway component EscV
MKKADNFNPAKWLVENKLTSQSKMNENPPQSAEEKDEIITNVMQQYDFDIIPKNIFFSLKEFLIDVFEEDFITVNDVKQQIDFMEEKLGGIEKELKRKGY